MKSGEAKNNIVCFIFVFYTRINNNSHAEMWGSYTEWYKSHLTLGIYTLFVVSSDIRAILCVCPPWLLMDHGSSNDLDFVTWCHQIYPACVVHKWYLFPNHAIFVGLR
jgi:hypothetical protein